MGLFDKIRGEFIDIIEWQDTTHDTIVWRFPRYNNEIKMGAKLTVRIAGGGIPKRRADRRCLFPRHVYP
jgi:membrane protease subunit (stomatin/prohibitin family)